MPPPATLTCLLIADDLTGACDSAVQFALRGYKTVVRLSTQPEAQVGQPFQAAAGLPAGVPAEVTAISTESRNVGQVGNLRPIVNRPCVFEDAALRFLPRLLFQKIDSTWRGNVAPEIAQAAEAFDSDAALITPAFPAMSRTVDAGILRVAGADFEPIDLPAYWREQGLGGYTHVPPGGVSSAIAAGARFISIDASLDSDLDAIVAAGLASPRRILWVGSAGLASALARALPRGPQPEPARPPHFAAALFCLGSDHPVAIEQARNLAASRAVLALGAEEASPERIADALGHGVHIALRIPYGRMEPEGVRQLIGDVRPPLFLSGGDTASLVCRALGVHEIRLCGEIAPGVPRGVLAGGLFDGVPVVTKAGGFGRPDALIHIADYFTCPR